MQGFKDSRVINFRFFSRNLDPLTPRPLGKIFIFGSVTPLGDMAMYQIQKAFDWINNKHFLNNYQPQKSFDQFDQRFLYYFYNFLFL